MKAFRKNKLVYWILWTLFLGSFAAQLFYAPPGNLFVFHDAVRGLETWNRFLNGAPFNVLGYPNPMYPDVAIFLTWWTPGQYVIPGLLGFTGIPLQWVFRLVVLFSLISFFTGLHRLFRHWNFSSNTIWLTFIVLSWHQVFFRNFYFYEGGSVLWLSVLPWFVLFVNQNYEVIKKNFWLLPLFLWVGFFMKASFALFFMGGGLLILFKWYIKSKAVKDLVLFGAVGLLSILPVFWFINQGESPAQAVDEIGFFGMPNHLAGDLIVPWIHTFWGGVPLVNDFLSYDQWLLTFFKTPYLSYLVLVLPMFWLVRMIFFGIKVKGRPFLLIQSGVFILFFTYWYLTDKAISYEPRHFFGIGVLWLPFILRSFKYYMPAIAGFFLFVGATGFVEFQSGLPDTFTAVDGVKYPISFLEGHQLIKNVETKEGIGLFVDLDNWYYLRFTKSLDKICLEQKNNQWVVNTGVEHDAIYPVSQIDFSKYSPIYIFKKVGENPFEPPGFVLKSRWRSKQKNYLLEKWIPLRD